MVIFQPICFIGQSKYCSIIYADQFFVICMVAYYIIGDQCNGPTTTIQALRSFHFFEVVSYRVCVSSHIALSFRLWFAYNLFELPRKRFHVRREKRKVTIQAL